MAASRAQMATFESAFARLKDVVRASDAVEFQSTTLKDVFDAAQQIQELQRKRRALRYMGRVKPFLQCLEKYSKSIDTLCNGTPFLPWVWAPVKLILQIASDHPTVLDKLLDAYAQIAEALPRFDRFQSAFHYDTNIKQALALVYEDILEFHRHTYLFLRRGAWHIFFDSLWKDFAVRFFGILENLERHRDLVDREASSIAIIEAKKWRALQKDDIDRRDIERRDQRLQDCISWLAIHDRSQEDDLDRLSQRRQPGTCEWVLSSAHLRMWVENQNEEPVLWLKGIPGAGKSVLTSRIIQDLRQNPDLTTIFFFCNSHTDKGDLCSQVLRTLILELLRSQLHLTSHIFENYIRQGRTPSLGQTKKLLPELLSAVSSTRIIIDGLDECQEKDQKAILTELLSAVKNSATPCKLFISSRAETYISRTLRKRPTISLTEKRERDKVDKDIQKYVKHSLMGLRESFPSTVVDDVERMVVRKANGMFLWVRLVITELLDRESVYELQKAAHNLPQGLHKAYRRILDRIKTEYSEYNSQKAMTILQWMACSFRPLKIFEIQDGLVFEAADNVLNDETKPTKNLLELCKPIIEEGLGNTVEFVHFSAKEYILHPTSGPFLQERDAHLTVTYACATYLSTSHCLIDNRCSEMDQVLRVAKGFHGLHLYAHEFLMKHLLRYAELQRRSESAFSEGLRMQLQRLDLFRKRDLSVGFKAALSNHKCLGDTMQQLSTLQLPSSLHILIRDMLVFQAMSAQDYHHQTEPQEIQRLEIENDPTILNQILHQYQSITEFLLETPDSSISGIEATLVRDFKNIYGDSALLCRYRPCPRATLGFAKARDRDRHESSHTRRFKCGDLACEFYESGFSTKAALQKHNEVYHRKMNDFVLPIRRRQNFTDLREKFLDSKGPSKSLNSSVTTSLQRPPGVSISSKRAKRLAVFDRTRRSWKEDMLDKRDYEVNLKLNAEGSSIPDLDEQILQGANVFHNPLLEALPASEDEYRLPKSLKKLSLSDYREKQLRKSNLRQRAITSNTPEAAEGSMADFSTITSSFQAVEFSPVTGNAHKRSASEAQLLGNKFGQQSPNMKFEAATRMREQKAQNDGLTEEEWLKAVGDDEDLLEAAAARKAREERHEQNKLQGAGQYPGLTETSLGGSRNRAEARALREQLKRTSPEESTPKTISPKDVDLFFNENDEEASLPPLFPPPQQQRQSTHLSAQVQHPARDVKSPQRIQAQRPVAQRRQELEQVPELGDDYGENPADFLRRDSWTGTTKPPHEFPTASSSPTVFPTNDSLTAATTISSGTSRESSLLSSSSSLLPRARWYEGNDGPWIPTGVDATESQSQWYEGNDGPWIPTGVDATESQSQWSEGNDVPWVPKDLSATEPQEIQERSVGMYGKSEGLPLAVFQNYTTERIQQKGDTKSPLAQPNAKNTRRPWDIVEYLKDERHTEISSTLEVRSSAQFLDTKIERHRQNADNDPLNQWYKDNDGPWIPKTLENIGKIGHAETSSRAEAQFQDITRVQNRQTLVREPIQEYYNGTGGKPWIPKTFEQLVSKGRTDIPSRFELQSSALPAQNYQLPINQNEFQLYPNHSRNTSLGPESAAFPQGGEWSTMPPQFTGHRRRPTEYSDVSVSAAQKSQNNYQIFSPEGEKYSSPLQLREAMLSSRSESPQSPLRSNMSWEGETLDYGSYQKGLQNLGPDDTFDPMKKYQSPMTNPQYASLYQGDLDTASSPLFNGQEQLHLTPRPPTRNPQYADLLDLLDLLDQVPGTSSEAKLLSSTQKVQASNKTLADYWEQKMNSSGVDPPRQLTDEYPVRNVVAPRSSSQSQAPVSAPGGKWNDGRYLPPAAAFYDNVSDQTITQTEEDIYEGGMNESDSMEYMSRQYMPFRGH